MKAAGGKEEGPGTDGVPEWPRLSMAGGRDEVQLET